jgi:para-aminobenzoate synthetase / 4-amino-4-deoxychorismate lyase
MPDFAILESLLWTPGNLAPPSFRPPSRWIEHIDLPSVTEGWLLLEAHLARMQQSAEFFGFHCDLAAIRRQMEQTVAGLGSPAPDQKVRLLLHRDGIVECQAAPLTPVALPLRVQIAPLPVPSGSPFLRYKTTHRPDYEAAQAACPAAQDVLLWDAAGRLTESCLANIVCELNGALLTPAEGDLLPGVLRGWMLESGIVRTANLFPADLPRARQVWLVNSVRGWQPVQVFSTGQGASSI